MDETAGFHLDEIGEAATAAEREAFGSGESTLPMHGLDEFDGFVGEDETRGDETSSGTDSTEVEGTRQQARIDDLEDRYRRIVSERDRLQRRVLSAEKKIAGLQRRMQEDEDFTSQNVGSVFRTEDVIRRAAGAERALSAAHEEIEALNHRILLLESGDATAALDQIDEGLAEISAVIASEAQRGYVPSGAPLGVSDAVRVRFEEKTAELTEARAQSAQLEEQVSRLQRRLTRAREKTAEMREELLQSRAAGGHAPSRSESSSQSVSSSVSAEVAAAPPKAAAPPRRRALQTTGLPQFPGLRVERQLEGEDQTVAFHARDVESRKPVCVRILAGGLAGFRLERLEALTLVRHAALFEVLDAGEYDGSTFVVSDRPSGETLHAWMERIGPMPASAALALAVQVARGLRQASFHGVHHGDLAPASIRVDASGRVRVDRIGLLGLRPDNISLVPHPEYAAPERLRAGPEPDDRSDIYSLGAILHRMLTGLPPYSGDREEVQRGQRSATFPDARTVRPEVPDQLAEVVLKMGARDADQRYADWDQALTALERAGGRSNGPAALHTLRKRVLGFASSNPAAFAAVAMAPIVLAALIATLLV